MPVTEDEAKQKWCPFARSRNVSWFKTDIKKQISQTMETNYYDEAGDVQVSCIGSECMAWRWSRTQEEAKAQNEFEGECNNPNFFQAEGYCGLAGKP